MNLDFSAETLEIRDQARRMLRQAECRGLVRQMLGGTADPMAGLWRRMADLGWAGVVIPPDLGGNGIGPEAACALAAELGASLAPVPFTGSAIAASTALVLCQDAALRQRWLPALADGSRTVGFALVAGDAPIRRDSVTVAFAGGRISGQLAPVAWGGQADAIILPARDGGGQVVLVLVETRHAVASPLPCLDLSRPQARLTFDNAPASLLPVAGDGWDMALHLLDHAAILTAFEEVGGAQACLDMAVAYALDRHAFGRPIGANQAIKHKLADVYVAVELARSNAYLAALSLISGERDLALVAATARVSSSQAYALASAENIQTHGGLGYTWEADPHLYYRRAAQLALEFGAPAYWADRLVASLPLPSAA